MPVRRSILSVLVVLLVFAGSNLYAQATFKSTYSGAVFITPINTNAQFLPKAEFQPVLSGSIEYSFPKTDKLGFEVSGGYYPYASRDEVIGRFGIRHFGKANAPAGAFWEMTLIGGATFANPATPLDPTSRIDPLFGIGARIGSVRISRFGSFAFEYGAGPSVILTGGQTQLRAEFYFGLGFVLGHEEIIEGR